MERTTGHHGDAGKGASPIRSQQQQVGSNNNEQPPMIAGAPNSSQPAGNIPPLLANRRLFMMDSSDSEGEGSVGESKETKKVMGAAGLALDEGKNGIASTSRALGTQAHSHPPLSSSSLAPSTSLKTVKKSRSITQEAFERDQPPLYSLDHLGEELTCPLCRRLLLEPIMLATECCMHRFCLACLERQLEKHGHTALNKCPECRADLPGGRSSFRRDTNFAALVQKLKGRGKRRPAKRRAVEAMRADGIDIDFYLINSAQLLTANSPPSSSASHSPTKARLSRSPLVYSSSTPVSKKVKDEPTSPTKDQSFSPMRASKEDLCGGATQPSPHKSRSSLSTSFASTSATSTASQRQADEEDSFNASALGLAPCQPLNLIRREDTLPVVLYPDGSVFRGKGGEGGDVSDVSPLPCCLKQPRYLYVPLDATIGHFAEYLVLRAEIEAKWKERGKYFVQFTRVEEERNEFSLWLDKSKDTAYLPLTVPDCNLGSGCLFVVRSSQDGSNFNIILTLKHPFEPIASGATVGELWQTALQSEESQRQREKWGENGEVVGDRGTRPLKLVYRFVERGMEQKH